MIGESCGEGFRGCLTYQIRSQFSKAGLDLDPYVEVDVVSKSDQWFPRIFLAFSTFDEGLKVTDGHYRRFHTSDKVSGFKGVFRPRSFQSNPSSIRIMSEFLQVYSTF